MKKLRVYGEAPYRTAVIHGGPGAPGEMASVARELSASEGILEPLQTAKTIEGQIEELVHALTSKGSPPMILLGWSWGAWLSYLTAAENPGLVKKLILISSGPFEEKNAQNIMKTRLERMNEKEKAEALLLMDALEKPAMRDKDDALLRLGKLIAKADSYDPIPHRNCVLYASYETFRSVWEQAAELRSKGLLLEYGKKIQCPVVAIHGDFDPHPAEGIRQPLSRILKDFRFILLKNCGHTPWIERLAKDPFYEVLKRELNFSP